MTTEEIINDMRSHTITSMQAAGDRLEELQQERDKARAELLRVRKASNEHHLRESDDFDKGFKRLYAQIDFLKQELHNATTVNQQLTVRPEPSRLEIAGMLLAAMCGSQYTWTNAEGIALRKADALIAAAKEAK